MRELTSNEISFIRFMVKSDEHARHGFELLLKREDFADFFDHLKDAKLFDPSRNSGPVAAGKEGYVQIPYWDSLTYLEAVAKKAGETNDCELATKVLEVIRAATKDTSADGKPKDNYHTWRVFAEILAEIPMQIVTRQDLDLIATWLSSRFDTGLVGHAIGKRLLPRLLASGATGDWDKACRILYHCTAVQWIKEKGFGSEQEKPVSVLEDYWLKQLLEYNAKAFGEKAGADASSILLGRLKEVFVRQEKVFPSSLWRPAIEDHPQNHDWYGPENRFVEGLRNVILSWMDTDPEAGKPFLKELLSDELEIARRIGIYVVNQRFELSRDLLAPLLQPALFNGGHIHELYDLLAARFGNFTNPEKVAVLKAIEKLPLPQKGDDRERARRYIQRNWLSSVYGKGSNEVDQWYVKLNSDSTLGALSEHSNFHSYIESGWGPGPSPYQVPEIIAFAADGTLIERLNAFQQAGMWRGPSTKALVDALEGAVKNEPVKFIAILDEFLKAKRPYQYGVISGFKQLWDSTPPSKINVQWAQTWKKLFAFFEELLLDVEFWNETVVEQEDMTPTRDWIPPLVCDFIHSGTLSDEKSFAPDLLPNALVLINALLQHLPAELEADETDAMSRAINSPKGKAIETLVSYALRACRLADSAGGEHAKVWASVEPIFDRELQKCQNENFEFSTLMGSYIANLHYLSPKWLENKVMSIFPTNSYTRNFACAAQGLAYAPASRDVYGLLRNKGIINVALQREISGRHARENLLQRIALAYLWGDEKIDSAPFEYLFKRGKEEDLSEISQFFWSVKNQEVTAQQVNRILLFWKQCLMWADGQAQRPKALLSRLSALACYLNEISEEQKEWLLKVAPFVEIGYNADQFIEQLGRLVDSNPDEVILVLRKLLETYKPYYGFEDRLHLLVEKIAAKKFLSDAIGFADKLRGIKGFQELYEELKTTIH